MANREPVLAPVPIADLRPTQMTVGYREVAEKRRRWRDYDDDKRAAFLGAHMVPTLLGPKKRHYVIDHHHLSRALLEEGVESVLVTVVADLHHLDKDAFWTVCDHKSWVHPYDAEGVRAGFKDIPKAMADLADDPYRSLAGELRRAGGFAKDTTPFSEFLWADYLRRHVKAKRIENDFSAALEEAMALAKASETSYLPGWCGPTA
ncbi:chromosome partitioning protein ParB [Methylobacterium sp. WL103]|uniref:ParB-like protein n=1 Tax=unclassified Methylobacterium TaxID=2615210 RepID=UPI0011C79B3D|nr:MULTISPECIES: ParB-like protein [unclassified Methylobacterium]TXM76015.1 chromosome partitioning protein ParB [Methylobacterium sp. WL12]TXM95752.1 chromosome partitioning protein ParB [Methylobacterium sp. WL103]